MVLNVKLSLVAEYFYIFFSLSLTARGWHSRSSELLHHDEELCAAAAVGGVDDPGVFSARLHRWVAAAVWPSGLVITASRQAGSDTWAQLVGWRICCRLWDVVERSEKWVSGPLRLVLVAFPKVRNEQWSLWWGSDVRSLRQDVKQETELWSSSWWLN